MRNVKILFILFGSVVTLFLSSCVKSIEKVHSPELRKEDPSLQGITKCYDDGNRWEFSL